MKLIELKIEIERVYMQVHQQLIALRTTVNQCHDIYNHESFAIINETIKKELEKLKIEVGDKVLKMAASDV